MKEHLQQVGFQWSYSHEDLLPGELSQQQVLIKSMIPTLEQMSRMDKEEEFIKVIEVKNKGSSEWVNIVRIKYDDSSSSSSMSLYKIDSDKRDSKVSSRQTPTLIGTQVPEQLEEVHSSPTTDKNKSERHSHVQQEEEDPLSYNIDEIFESFTFNLHKKEVSRKRVRSKKQNDGTVKEVQEDEVLFEKTNEDMITVATTLATLSNATVHNVAMLSDKLSQAESDNNRLKDEVLSLKAKIKKRRKVEDGTTSLRATILNQQAKLFDVKM